MLDTMTLKPLFYIIPEKFYEILSIFIELIQNFSKYFFLYSKKKFQFIHVKYFCELPFYVINFWHISLIGFLSNTFCINCFQKNKINKYLETFLFMKKIHKHGKKFLTNTVNTENTKGFFENINFNDVPVVENKDIIKNNFCNNCKKNIPLQNLDAKYFISYFKIKKKRRDKMVEVNNLNDDLVNLLKKIRIIILNSIEIRENLRKLWHSDPFFFECFFKGTFLFRIIYKIYWSSFIDFNNFFIKSINGKAFFDNFYDKRTVISKTIIKYHFNLIKTKINNIEKNLDYKTRLKKNNKTKGIINLQYKILIQRLQQKLYIFRKNNRIRSLNKIMEKKKGLVRNNIISKRVNYSSRTIITPDPFIKGGCIGFSGTLAKTIHLVDYFTPWNIAYYKRRNQDFVCTLKKKKFELYLINKITKDNSVFFSKIAKKTNAFNLFIHLKNNNNNEMILFGKPFLRTIYDNDYMIANRQPTLHRLGIMGHRSKVLSPSLTFSINYINCKSYNADFDGDEINVHIMQSIQSKVEIIGLVSSDLHTVVPGDGSIIRHFIQDCLVSMTLLSKKDNFIDEKELKEIIIDDVIQNAFLNSTPTIYISSCKKKFWTGKQIFSYVLKYFTQKNCKINHFFFKDDNFKTQESGIIKSEEKITFLLEGNLLIGDINKDDFKNKGMFLRIHEHLGNTKFSDFIKKLDKICFSYIARHGLTLGPDEIKLSTRHDSRIKYNMSFVKKLFKRISGRMCEFISLFFPSFVISKIFKRTPIYINYVDDNITGFESFFRKKIMDYNVINRFYKKDSDNSFVCIIDSGSKGSYRNMELICFRMGDMGVDGAGHIFYSFCKTTESFFFFTNYFLGLNSLEFYLHSISGRIGILKSSLTVFRSGYLQRTIIKNIENIYIAEDFTFREISNTEMITFSMGTDNINYNHFSYKKYHHFINNYFLEKITKLFKSLFYKNKQPINFLFQNIFRQRSLLFANLNDTYMKFVSKSVFIKKSNLLIQKSNINPRNTKLLIKILETLNIENILDKQNQFNCNIFLNHVYSAIQIMYQLMNTFKAIHFNDYIGILCGQSLCQPLTQMTLDSFHNIGLLDHGRIDGILKLCFVIQEIRNTKKNSILVFSLDNKSVNKKNLPQLFFNSINHLTASNILNNVFVVESSTNTRTLFFSYILSITKGAIFCNTLKLNLKLICKKLKKLFLMNFLKFFIYKFILKKLTKYEKINIKSTKKFKKFKKKTNYKKFSKYLYNININTCFSTYGCNFYISFGVKKTKHCMRYVFKVFKKKLKIIYYFIKKNMLSKYFFIDYRNNILQLSIILSNSKFSVISEHIVLRSTNKLNVQYINKINHTKTNYLLGGSFGNIITQGINVVAILKYKKFLKVNSIYLAGHSNFLYFFGIEAAYSKLYKEIVSVLKILKTYINPIYLKLIANFMTYKGFVIKLNRYGMKFSGSNVHRMGYENIYNYFKEGIEKFFIEKAQSHSSSLLLGEKIKNGTGNNRKII